MNRKPQPRTYDARPLGLMLLYAFLAGGLCISPLVQLVIVLWKENWSR